MKLYYEPEKANESLPKEEHVLQGHDLKIETKNQHEKMKDKPFKEKASYYIGYYKFHALGVIAGIAILISIIHSIATNKDYCFGAMIINSSNIDSGLLAEDFSAYAGLDTNKYECYIDANEDESLTMSSTAEYGTSTRFAALISTADLDITIYDSVIFENKALNSVYADLRTVLSEEDIEKYSDRFYYIDQKIIDELEESNINNEASIDIQYPTKDEQKASLEYHTTPENMTSPVPVGIIVNDASLITTLDAYYDMVPVFGIITNSQRKDVAVDFLHYIYDENIDFAKLQYYVY